MAQTFIYALIDPRDNRVRYVGKTNNPNDRLNSHIKESKRLNKNHRHHWINTLIKNGLFPLLEIIDECQIDDWQEREKYWIKYYRDLNFDLVNSTDGGDGTPGHGKYSVSDELRKRLSLFMTGKKMSDETKRKLSFSRIGKKYKNDDNYRKEKYIDNSNNRRGRKLKQRTTSVYSGVRWNKNRWQVQLSVGGKQVYVGRFENEVDAARAYDDYVLSHNIPSKLNFRV